MDDLQGRYTRDQRYLATLFSILAGIAVLLAAIGVYGVLAFIVAESTHEIGMRMALGALPGNILRLILGRGMMLAAAGIVIGVPVYFLAARLLGSYLTGMGPADATSPVVAAVRSSGTASSTRVRRAASSSQASHSGRVSASTASRSTAIAIPATGFDARFPPHTGER